MADNMNPLELITHSDYICERMTFIWSVLKNNETEVIFMKAEIDNE